MRLDHVVRGAGQHQIIVGSGGEPRLYRNRTRLLLQAAGDGWVWQGKLDEDDLLELDGDAPLKLQIFPVAQRG
jgi:hypothetical protein